MHGVEHACVTMDNVGYVVYFIYGVTNASTTCMELIAESAEARRSTAH